MNLLVAVALGAGVGLGLMIFIAGVRGVPVLPTGERRRLKRGPVTETGNRLWLLALLLGALTWLVTGWLAAGLLAGCATLVLPRMFGEQTARRDWIAKTQAIAAWTEMLRDTMSAADGVEEAIAATVPIAPTAIRREVSLLDARRRSEQPLTEALAMFGAELDHPSGDLVVAALTMAAAGEGSDFVGVLTRLSSITRDEVKMRLGVEASRAQLRTASRMIIGVLLFCVLALAVLSRGYLEPYESVGGQFALVVIGGIFAAGILMMEKMSQYELPERFTPRRISSSPRSMR